MAGLDREGGPARRQARPGGLCHPWGYYAASEDAPRIHSEGTGSPTYSGRKTPSLAADLADFGRALQSLIDPYRPELYYMRSPGPKWRAKHPVAKRSTPP